LVISDVEESPYWPLRVWHIHTQHPLELTHVLNGWGEGGDDDKEGWLLVAMAHDWGIEAGKMLGQLQTQSKKWGCSI